jgi:RNA polymerase sigma-70 factor, ECF subfamily
MSFEAGNIEILIDSCIAGVASAQKAMYKMFFSYGKSICLRYSSTREDAEEVLNDGFMKVFKNLDKYDRSKSFKAWFRTILVNTCIDFYRKKEKLTYEYDDVHYEGVFYEENAFDKLAAEDILAMVQRLSVSYRTVFLMYAVDGYSHKEIADQLNINEVTSRTNFLKARSKLQVMIQESYQKMNGVKKSDNKIDLQNVGSVKQLNGR